MNSPPARIGMSLEDVETPALILDLAAYETNLYKLQTFADENHIQLRPHAKTHKCAAIAQQQIALGAVGICCQKTSEAEALILAGVSDVLIANEVVGAAKMERLAALTSLTKIAVCVDDEPNVSAWSNIMRSHGGSMDILVELDVGAGRCGVLTAAESCALAHKVAESPGLRFKGLQAYHGGAQHIRDYVKRRDAITDAANKAAAARDLLDAQGIECDIITGAGTGTYPFEAGSGVYNELQCGSYIFMDADYGRNLMGDGSCFTEFANSLFVYASVMSKTRPATAVLDAGLKAVSVDSGMPLVIGMEQVFYDRASDEHGQLDTTHATTTLSVGDKLMLIPGHCDPTVNLHDWLVGYRGDRVETIWPITARGALL